MQHRAELMHPLSGFHRNGGSETLDLNAILQYSIVGVESRGLECRAGKI